ncbi:MAG: SdrD B-like domain-containing protein [Beutenbergiaceae bacterium]
MKRLIAATAAVATVATGVGFGLAPAAWADSRNELVITRVFDGTPNWEALGATEDPVDNGTDAPATHYPGNDSGSTNNVVRTWDLFGVQVDWNVNEDAATDVWLDVTMQVRGGDPSAADIAWVPDQTGMFTGCGPASEIVGLTLRCELGDQTEGSHGVIRPTARLGAGVDGSVIDVSVTMRTGEDPGGISDDLETPFTVSERPVSNWVKGAPVFTRDAVTVDGQDGYVVLFPIGLTSADVLQNKVKGSGPISTGTALTFYDHAWDLADGARLANPDEIAAANAAGNAIYGDPVGAYDASNAGKYPVTAGTWSSSDLGSPNGYPVYELNVSDYVNTAQASNADGSANAKGYVLTGQIVMWLPAGAVDGDMIPDGVEYHNSISQGDQTTVIGAPADVVRIEVYGSGGAMTFPEPDISDNTSRLAMAPSTAGGTDGNGAFFSHYGTFGRDFSTLYDNSNAAPSVVRRANFPLIAPAAGNFWTGKGEVSRGMPITMNLGLFVNSEDERTESIAGCMRWDPRQISLLEFPSYENRPRQAAWGPTSEHAPTGLLENLMIGDGAGSRQLWGYNEPWMLDLPASELASLGITIEYGYETGTSTWWGGTDNATDNNLVVPENSMDCNNAANRVWVDSTDLTALQGQQSPDGRYAFDMVRVRIDNLQWQSTSGIGMISWHDQFSKGAVLSLQGVVNQDMEINHDDQSLYLFTSRARGAWDPSTVAQPPTESCLLTGTDDITLDDDPVLPSANGWCNQPYTYTNENDPASSWTVLDEGNFTSLDTTPNRRAADSDADHLRIVKVRPAVSKTNDAGVFDIQDNGGTVDFTINVSAVGSDREALADVTLEDALPAGYVFEELLTGPSTPGATCDLPAVGTQGTISCRFSEPDPLDDDSALPQGLPGGWSDSIQIRVRVEGASANARSYRSLINEATIVSGGLGPWAPTLNGGEGGWDPLGLDPIDEDQSASDSARSYMPLSSDRGAIVKMIDGDPCVVNPTATITDEDWADRCSMIDLDVDDANLSTGLTDADGNMTFRLQYENLGNSELQNVRIVDVLPFNGDGPPTEPASDSADNGVDSPTTGDGRTPGSDFDGSLGLVSVTGVIATADAPDGYWVTNADPSLISRDPNNAITDVVWCNPDGTIANLAQQIPGAIGGCPTGDYDVSAVFAYAPNIPVGATTSLDLVLDTEAAACDSLWTNTFGARTDQIALPIRSNDVSAMTQCEFDLALQKRVDADWYWPADWAQAGESIVEFEIEVINQGDPVEDFDVTDYIDTDVFEFATVENGTGGTSEPGTLGSSGTGPALAYTWETSDLDNPVATFDGVLGAGDSTILTVYLRVVSLDAPLDNYAEISRFDSDGDSSNGDSTDGTVTDVDSTPDGENNEPGDDVLIDDEIDLTPTEGDEDDHDIASVPWWDLSLVKDLSDGQTRQVTVADNGSAIVSFDIIVKNQGSQDALDVQVVDTPPLGFYYSGTNPSGLVDIDGVQVDYMATDSLVIPRLDAGTQVRIPVVYEVNAVEAASGTLLNSAEIASFTNTDGEVVPDVDSTPDTNPDNDNWVDPEGGTEGDGGESPDFDADGDDNLHNRGSLDEDDHDTEPIELVYSLGNEVWFDSNNNGLVDDGEEPIPGVTVELFTDEDGDGNPDDRNGDGVIDSDDAVDSTVTDDDGLYLFSGLVPGEYIVAIPGSNWAEGGPLTGLLSSGPTELDPNDDVDQNDNGWDNGQGMVVSGPVTIGDLEPIQEPGPDNDANADPFSNLTVDFGFYLANFDLALRKRLSAGQPDVVEIGDLVTWDIEVFNQGDVTATGIQLVDYLPLEMELADSDWAAGPNRTATIELTDVVLEPGQSTVVQITTRVLGGGDIDNYAEISQATPVDEEGDPVTTPDGKNIPDVDSVPDTDNTDELIDDEINKTPQTGDEDDHDIASIRVDGPPLPRTGLTPLLVWSAVIGLLLVGLGSALVIVRRRRA